MRIFTAIRHSKDPARCFGDLWSRNFYPAFNELGHDVVESQVDLLPVSRFMDVADRFTTEELAVRSGTTELVLDELRRAHRQRPVDLFLSYFYNAHFDPVGFDEVRRLGIPSVNFFCNSIYQFALVADVAAAADLSWHPERDAGPLYRAAGARPICVQMGADPRVYRPVPGVVRQPKASFVGQRYADRDVWAGALLTAGVPIHLYGAGWNRTAESADESLVNTSTYLGRVRFRPGSAGSYCRAIGSELATSGLQRGVERLVRRWRHRTMTRRVSPLLNTAARGPARSIAQTFARYEVVVNFSNVWSDGRPGSPLVPHVRLRDFEAPMSRACYLTGHTDEIAEFYEAGREIDTYRTPEELVDKTRFYLRHPGDSERLRECGYRRALHDHTWTRRFESLFAKIRMAV